jgi:hypothetical protein
MERKLSNLEALKLNILLSCPNFPSFVDSLQTLPVEQEGSEYYSAGV